MTNPDQQTPAPLSFHSPQVRKAHEWAVTQRPYKLLTISERSALILADALTHEHEARVKAEAGLHSLATLTQSILSEHKMYPFLPGKYGTAWEITRAALSGMLAQAGVKDL